MLGLGLGLLFVPCAGPVLATIAVVGATHHVGFGALVLTVSFGVGGGVPLLAIALAGDAHRPPHRHAPPRARAVRLTGGVVMILAAAAIGLNLTDGLQRHVPGYTTALQNSVESKAGAATVAPPHHDEEVRTQPGSRRRRRLHRRRHHAGELRPGAGHHRHHRLAEHAGRPTAQLGVARRQGRADRLLDVLVHQLPAQSAACRGVVPRYRGDGCVVIGVHTPEFAFEHVTSNVRAQAASLGVTTRSRSTTTTRRGTAFSNQYWPAEYLIDPSGIVRHVTFGEGDYGATESLIRQLLTAANPA